MRILFIVAAALATAAPALAQGQQIPRGSADDRIPEAQEYEPIDPADAELTRDMPSRGEVEAMGDVAARTVDAILDVPIGPLREAVEGRPLSRRERAETLGDMASKDDPYYRERMRGQIGAMSAGVGAMVRQMAVLAPVMRQVMEDAARRVEEAIEQAPYPAEAEPERGE